MRLDHRLRDGHAKPGAAFETRPGRVRGVEPLEDLGAGVLGHARTMVAEADHRVVHAHLHGAAYVHGFDEVAHRGIIRGHAGQRFGADRRGHDADGYLHRGVGGRVAVDVADDVGDHLPQPRPVAFQRDIGQRAFDELQIGRLIPVARLECQRAAANLTARIERVQVFGRVRDQRGQRHLLGDVDATPLVEARQRQQVLHQYRHAGARILDMRDRLIGASQRTRQVTLHLV